MAMAEAEAPEVVVRYGGGGDAEAIASMISGLVAEFSGAPPASHPEADAGVLSCTKRMLSLRGAFWALVVDRNDEAVGVMMIHERTAVRVGDVYGKITELYIAPGARGRGFGGRLVEQAKILARERGWSRLEVGRPTTIDSQRAHAIFIKHGFAFHEGVLHFTLASEGPRS